MSDFFSNFSDFVFHFAEATNMAVSVDSAKTAQNSVFRALSEVCIHRLQQFWACFARNWRIIPQKVGPARFWGRAIFFALLADSLKIVEKLTKIDRKTATQRKWCISAAKLDRICVLNDCNSFYHPFSAPRNIFVNSTRAHEVQTWYRRENRCLMSTNDTKVHVWGP